MKPGRLDSPVARTSTAQSDIFGEPTPSGPSSSSSSSHLAQGNMTKDSESKITVSQAGLTFPMTTAKLTNQQSPLANRKRFAEHKSAILDEDDATLQMDKLASRFHEKLAVSKENSPASVNAKEVTEPTAISDPSQSAQDEVTKLKLQLEAAKTEIARQQRELSQQKATEQTTAQMLNTRPDVDFRFDQDTEPVVTRSSSGLHSHFGHTTERSAFTDRTLASSPASLERFQGPWGTGLGGELYGQSHQEPFNSAGWTSSVTPPWSSRDVRAGPGVSSRFPPAPQPQKPNMLRLDTFEDEQSFANPSLGHGYRRPSMPNTRPGSATGSFYNGFNMYPPPASPQFSPPITPMSYQQMMNNQQQAHFQYPGPIGSPLSPTAIEFSGNNPMLDNGPPHGNPWNSQGANESTSTYMAPMEPMNYRRLLDRNMSCNWSYVVDKIVCNNDQQASIFLQQKLKVATPEQKYDLVEAIVKQAYGLMVNRFGNFLVQRCFEHGTPEQVIAIAKTIQGRVISLSTDAFGCHVVQKAFDVVPDDYKAVMVHELLRNIPETVIHRYACHVWQKLFELRWADSPPQIMKYVNEALRGMWHEVALGETGSLVVQNIFENCLEEDKRPCINEVLASIDIVSHGQFGNWCIQHICEHGAPADKSRAIEHVLRYSTEYSTDQFASKVIEKCLKVGGAEFLERYLERVCEARQDRPRMPLIDIAGDQYGNYLVQYILIHANPQHREIVANHVRKHMVSLRGSKFGSRVAMLCCNPASATRPGPPVGMQTTNRFVQNMPMTFPRPTGPYR